MQTSDFQLTNANGVIRGIISRPNNGQPIGALICLHGSPNGDLHGNAFVFDQISEKAVAMNFLTVQFSMFGSKPSDGQQEKACIRTQLIDYNSILNFSEQNFGCPIYVIGESAGATIASIKWLHKIKGYILLWPAFDLSDTDLKPYLTEEWKKLIDEKGYLNDNGVVIGKELFNELLEIDFSPSFKLPKQDILIMHGQSDKEVPFSQSIKALSNANGNITFITNKEADHGFKEPSCRKIVLEEIEHWLKKY
jgi:hypothetical protein